MQFIVALIKKMPIVPIALGIGGLMLGLLIGWVIAPVNFVDATPSYLRADLQEDYLRMAIDSFRLNQSPDLAVQRWQNLGLGAPAAFNAVQANPGNQDPAVINAYYEVITEVLAPQETTGEPSAPSTTKNTIIIFATVLVLGVAIAAVFYLYRFLSKRGSGEVTPTMQSVEISRNAEKTNFEQMGLAPPITQTMTTYVLGDDLYDESFSIDTQAGEFMGEYGVGVSE